MTMGSPISTRRTRTTPILHWATFTRKTDYSKWKCSDGQPAGGFRKFLDLICSRWISCSARWDLTGLRVNTLKNFWVRIRLTFKKRRWRIKEELINLSKREKPRLNFPLSEFRK